MNLDGSNVRRVGDAPPESGRELSPDGRQYAFSRNGEAGRVYLLDLFSGVERRVAGGP